MTVGEERLVTVTVTCVSTETNFLSSSFDRKGTW